jgi:hypothetical protein
MALWNRTVTLVLILGLCLVAAQPQFRINGIWRFTLDPVQPGLPQVPGKVLVFKSSGTDLFVSDPQTHTTFTGRARDASVNFNLPLGESGVETWTSKSAIFNGRLSGNSIFGTTRIGDSDVRWKAIKLPSAWECSNHKNPSHIATTDEEMRNLTIQHKCAGWHKLKLD